MIRVAINSKQFKKDMNNIMDYSYGFLEGVHRGKEMFFRNLGISIKKILESYIDASARMDPQGLHHVYEWYKTGSPNARLFDIKFTVNRLGLSFYSNFTQSKTIKDGSRVPFYDKATIMEEGIAVKIEPRSSDVLVFEADGETVFTKNPVNVYNPGGDRVQGSFQKVIDLFFSSYFSQAFIRSSGIEKYLNNPIVYKKNLSSGKKVGRSRGISTGYTWIANAGVNR